MNNSISFSIIVATLNAGELLRTCIDSALSQTYSAKEIIVKDAGSTDDTTDILRSYGSAIRHWESTPDTGIYAAWNRALEFAHGDWILFLGADDFLWDTNVLENVSASLASLDERPLFAYGNVVGIAPDGKRIGPLASPWSLRKFLSRGMYFSHQGVFHSASLFEDYGVFDESYRIGGDYELLLRAATKHSPIYFQDAVVAGMSLTGVSSHDTNSLHMYQEFLRAQRDHGIPIRFGLHWSILKSRSKRALYSLAGDQATQRLLHAYRTVTGRRKAWKE